MGDEQYVEEMFVKDIKPNLFMYNTFIYLYGTIREVLQVIGIESKWENGVKANLVTYNILINGPKLPKRSFVDRLYKQMKQDKEAKNQTDHIQHALKIYNGKFNDNYRQCMYYLKNMKCDGIGPDITTHNTLQIYGLHRRDLEKVEECGEMDEMN